MRMTRTVATWARLRGRGRQDTATTYLDDEARRDVDPLQAALHDAVTGLPERALLLDRMALALARARRKDEDVALLLLAIDDLPALSERLGAAQRDRVLREVAERGLRAVRDTDTVARFGPAEFAVLCDGVADRDTLTLVAGRVASALAKPYAVRFGQVDLKISLELLLVSGDTPPLTLLDRAEQALRS
jgi:diguanylate cyclase (GGDEF)-like protein